MGLASLAWYSQYIFHRIAYIHRLKYIIFLPVIALIKSQTSLIIIEAYNPDKRLIANSSYYKIKPWVNIKIHFIDAWNEGTSLAVFERGI
jgi:hypothetical protein